MHPPHCLTCNQSRTDHHGRWGVSKSVGTGRFNHEQHFDHTRTLPQVVSHGQDGQPGQTCELDLVMISELRFSQYRLLPGAHRYPLTLLGKDLMAGHQIQCMRLRCDLNLL
jgi:hypothetical protein